MVELYHIKGVQKQPFADVLQNSTRVTRGGGREVYPALFQKLEKSALIWGKNALIVVIYGQNFSFKMKSLRVS